MAKPEFGVIIASYDRHESLRRLLKGIADHFGQPDVPYEVIIANNALLGADACCDYP